MSASAPLLETRALSRHYVISRGLFRARGLVRALDGVSFTLCDRETLAVVGESGCGKSTLARAVTMIERPTSGALELAGTDVIGADRGTLKRLRPLVQMVFQNPYASLNPRKKVGTLLEEPLAINTDLGPAPAPRGGARDDGQGGAPARALSPLSAHVLGRAAAAHRDCTRADAAAAAGRRRRAAVRARRLDPGAGAEPAHGSAARSGDRVSLHLAQPPSRAPHRRRRAGDVPGQGRRGGREGSDLHRPAHPYTRALLASTPSLDGKRGGSASA